MEENASNIRRKFDDSKQSNESRVWKLPIKSTKITCNEVTDRVPVKCQVVQFAKSSPIY